MQSSKLQPSPSSDSQSSIDPKGIGWTAVSPRPNLTTEDGNVVLEALSHMPAERFASTPLESNVRSYSEVGVNSSSNDNVRVYVNQLGHTVKLAHLVAPPLPYSTGNRVQKNLPCNHGDSYERIKTKSAVETVGNRKDRDSCSGHQSQKVVVLNRVSSNPYCDGLKSAENGVRGGSKMPLKLGTRNANPSASKVKTQLNTKQNTEDNSGFLGVERSGSSLKGMKILDHSSAVKEEINIGLKTLMADLVELDLPTLASKPPLDIENDDVCKQMSLTGSEQMSFENGKENDSPGRQSFANFVDQNNVMKRPLSSRSVKSSSDNAVPKNSKLDSKLSSTSSLNSIHKTTFPLEKDNAKICRPQERKKNYDPEKAREYIRQQKQERMNRLKADRERQQADMQARKQKLDELSRTSLKLVKASVRRKPSHMNASEDHIIDPEKDHSENQVKIDDDVTDLPYQIDVKQSSTCSPQNSLEHYSISNIPLSPSDSNAQLINDICDMKNKIEAMAKSLKTTIESNRGSAVQSNLADGMNAVSTNYVTSNRSQSKTCNTLKKGNDARLRNTSDLAIPLDSKLQPPYLQSLTSNLRKMRESLQNVLSQSEVQSCTSFGKPKTTMAPSNHQRHRRFSSAGSDSAFEAMKLEENGCKVSSSDGRILNNLQKKTITTSFPTLPIAGNNAHHLEIVQHQNTSVTEADSRGPVANELSHSSPSLASQQFYTNQEDLRFNGNRGVCPEWLETITSRPYPINFISAVKQKIRSSSCGSENIGTNIVTPSVATAAFDPKAIMQQPSKSSPANGQSSLPPFVTVRGDSGSQPYSVSWSSHIPRATPAPLNPFSSAINDQNTTLFEQSRLENQINGAGASCRSSILEALNLEEMQEQFLRALNPMSDITPAEKPLSAPQTPAKTSLKLLRPSSAGKNRKLFSDDVSNEEQTLHSMKTADSKSNKFEKPDLDVLSDTDGATKLVPPNVNLASGLLDKKQVSHQDWFSQSRDDTDNNLRDQKENTPSPIQPSTSSKDTLEMSQVFNPTALHLQFQAELNILDSFNESLCQVMEVEKVRAVALARHQAISGVQTGTVSKEDKAIDAQTSLLNSNSEISSVNYKRGSGNPSDMTMLDGDSNTLKEHSKSNDALSSVLLEDGLSSPTCTAVSDALASSVKEEISDSVAAPFDGDDKTLPAPVNSTNSNGKKNTSEKMSNSVCEEIFPKLVRTQCDSLISKNGNPQIESSSENLDVLNDCKASNDNEDSSKFDRSISADVSVNSFRADSTFTGDDALVVDSLHNNDPPLFPTIVSGEDMFQFNLQMLEQLMHEEELRVQHRNTLMKLRVKVLGEMARTEVAALDLEKKKLREKGDAGHKDQMTALRKKQRGIMLRFQQQREEIERVRCTEDLAWQERRLMYLQQMHLIRMQISTHVMLHKFDKSSGSNPKKSKVIVKSIEDFKAGKSSHKGLSLEANCIPPEVPMGLAVGQSSSVSTVSLASEGSKSSAASNSSRKAAVGSSNCGNVNRMGTIDNIAEAGGDSESSHLEERVLKGLNELESRCRNLKEREKVLHERRQSVEQIIQWRRKLEEEERRLRDVERQAHSRHRTTFSKHMLRDRSTSPFQFLENGSSGSTSNGNNCSVGRSITDVARSGRNIKNVTSTGGRPIVTDDFDLSIPEEIEENSSKQSGESTLLGTNVEQYASESFESEISELKTQESPLSMQETGQSGNQKELLVKSPLKIDPDADARIPRMSERSNKYPGVTIKVPLSPRLQRVQRRRYSSGSDDSVVLSQTETGSEQSDIEGRISALCDQLHQFKAEAERLRREAKRTRNERLTAKEQSLHKQLQAYESYVSQLRRNLEAELKQSSVPIVRPQIKQPRGSPGKVASLRQDADLTSSLGTDRPSRQTSSPETLSHHRNESDTDRKEVEAVSEAISKMVSEGTSEITSEAVSEVPSDVASEAASEISENSSLVSQDAPSFLANRAVKEESHSEQHSVPNKEENTVEIVSCVESVYDNLNSETLEDTHPVLTESVDRKEEQSYAEAKQKSSPSYSESSLYELELESTGVLEGAILTQQEKEHSDSNKMSANVVESEMFSAEKDDALTDNKDDVTASIDQVKSITSEDDLDDANESYEEEPGALANIDVMESNVIRVIVREKETLDAVQSDIPENYTEVKRERLVDSITNNILKSLLNECLRTATPTRSLSQDAVLNRVLNKSLHEATIDIMGIYRRRLQTFSNQSKDVRKRVHEILAETHASSKLRATGRIKEMMTTTYGVLTPEDSPCGSPNLSSSPTQQLPGCSVSEDADTTYNEMAETSALKSNLGKASDAPMGLMGDNIMDSEGFSQEWFDEDFGLTRSRREAEELRRQQLQIEQEIQQLQQQQAQVQEQIPYYYVREIPNKPPPPYTPPGQAPRVLSSSTSLATTVEEVRSVCTDRPVILNAIASAVDLLYDVRSHGSPLEAQEPPLSFLEAGCGFAQPSHLSEQDLAIHQNNAKVYRRFLFDLAKELVVTAYSCDAEDPSPPWLRPENWVRRRKALSVVPRSKEMLHNVISRQVLVLFGFVPKASKENLTIRWSRKKRDHVDELLVRESQEEERQWTNYEQDEAVVKNNVAMAMLDSLLDDTVQVLGNVFKRREQRKHCSVH